ncbi:FtsK/SpoIIIE domain-containing protein [Terrabacter sp. MAHUQ-38]|uniref:FtsK/SpoIIIE domain-containing protein n=1 Tax=unclassified Terrabacter TaxID=2630222 RepID=UPI00165E3F5E|nr:FHA domain-containing protein [Terrabacter sp. MAHUQ-38]
MRLTITVVDPSRASAPRRHVTIEAPAGTPFGRVRSQLGQVVSATGARFAADGRMVSDDAVIGVPPLLRGALLRVVRDDESTSPRAGSGAVELRVVGGVGAGHVMALGRGEHVVGRATSASVRLEDPGISRAHAVLEVRPDGVHVRDLEPTNASLLDGVPLPGDGSPLRQGQRLRVGSTTLVLGRAEVRGGRHEVVAGEVHVHRRPRFRDRESHPIIAFPERPRRPEHGRVPLLTSTAPLVLSAVLALALSSPALLLFALMSPVLLMGQWWSDRRAGRTTYRRQVKEHAAQLERARAQVTDAAREDARRRLARHPDLSQLEAVVRLRGTRLWERRTVDSDHLVLRVGTAPQPAGIDCTGPMPDPVPEVDDLPALVDLGRAGVVGVAGPRAHAVALAGSLILQIATWHTPRQLSLHLLVSTESLSHDWEWAAHLPHVSDCDDAAPRIACGPADVALRVAALQTLAASRRATHGATWAGADPPPADVVVLLDGASALRAVAGVSDLLRDGPAAGLVFICLDTNAESLPVESRATVEIDETRLVAAIREDGRALPGVVPDLPSTGWLESVSRAMAPLVDATPHVGSGALPREVSFAELHRAAGLDPLTVDGFVDAWTGSVRPPRALLGRTRDGRLEVDLAADGPHVLVGGTTGSGKSELLQTLVAGLAVTNRPDELAFVLVDYKGGSAFSECARLPHTVGLVTDLDAHLTTRALTSLDAEMKRRERLLARAGAKDLDDYRRQAAVRRELPRLARLVIVVDEFKALSDEFPDFIAGLVRVAALGRSLGLHLVLATQRPAGIVSADMRANISLRIALRVRDRTDSDDVIDAPDAAGLDVRTPGRACLRSGDGVLTTVQTAYLGHPPPHGPEDAAPVRVLVHDLLHGPASADHGSADDVDLPSELTALVDAANGAAGRLGIEPAAAPWLSPLPQVVTMSDLLSPQDDPLATGAPRVLLGLVDVPREQRRDVLSWQVGTGGHLGIAGGPRSGRSSALVAIALGLAVSAEPMDVHVHVLQGTAGPCARLAGLPHVGSVTTAIDPALTRRLVTRLLRQVDGDEPGPRHTIVIVDGWEAVEDRLGSVDHGAPVEDLYRLLRDGPAAGVHVVVGGGRALLSGRLPGLLGQRLVLHMPDPLDLTLAGADPSLAAVTRPPGRAVELPSGHEVQLAVPGLGPSPEETGEAINAVRDAHRNHPVSSSSWSASGASRPWRIAPLPSHIELVDVPDLPDVRDHPDAALVLGVGGDEAAPLAIDSRHRRFLVAGTSRSGRSTALAAIGDRLLAHGRHVVSVSPRRSPLSVWSETRGCIGLTPHDQTELVSARRGDPDLCFLVDDVELVDGSRVEEALVQAARLVDGTAGLVAVAADLARANAAFRGLVPEVARDGCGLLLGPASPTHGDVLGVRLELPTERRPGRGFLVLDGVAQPFQTGRVDVTTSVGDGAEAARVPGAARTT